MLVVAVAVTMALVNLQHVLLAVLAAAVKAVRHQLTREKMELQTQAAAAGAVLRLIY